jgi:DNA replication protein DnaC
VAGPSPDHGAPDPGRGTTHLAIAIAYRAIQNGFAAVFTTAAALIDDLSRASREGRMREALTRTRGAPKRHDGVKRVA